MIAWRWGARLVADIATLRAAWNSARGGWAAAWRDAGQILARRRVLVDTRALVDGGERVVLRTRVRLTGDTQTDILRDWLRDAPPAMVQALANEHFRSVAAATSGWAAAAAMIRLGTWPIVALAAVPGIISSIRVAQRSGWAALLADSWMWAAVILAVVGFLLRWGVRLWLRRKFSRGLG